MGSIVDTPYRRRGRHQNPKSRKEITLWPFLSLTSETENGLLTLQPRENQVSEAW
ncbi:hypothetical protein ES288_A04G048500v1 [Gossypium darwinii]|uniref:Uncharacterized protein n=1 Tax=Gossypium darwinii TaxID=34276 RepID=A0A5D2GV40_GOSDA|nr:hypothetical protein ES288_A04G048500v1 [Gossypium darwinii]